MTEAPYRAVLFRLSSDAAAMSAYLARMSADLTELDRLLSYQPAPAAPPVAPAVPTVAPPAAPAVARPERSEGWVGKVLAVAGVAVTLVGVVLLLVLAAQAGILRPEFRVVGGAVLAGALVAAGWWLHSRPGGRVGAIALAATGVAAAYIDVIAVTTIYDWVSAPVGLAIAAVVGGGGLTLARRWDSQQLGVLVFVPLTVLAPIVVGDFTLLLVGFMLALAAASLPVQLGKDWIWMHAARIAASTFPLLVALIAVSFDDGRDASVAAACGIAAALAIAAALILLPRTRNQAAMALLTAAGVLPVLCVSLATGRVVAAVMATGLAAILLATVLTRLVAGVVRHLWVVLAAVSALIAVTVAFDGYIAGPVLLAMAAATAVAGRRDLTTRWVAIGLGLVGGVIFLIYAPPSALADARETWTGTGISVLVSSVLLVACAITIGWSWQDTSRDVRAFVWAGSAAVVVYAVTAFTVTTGVLVGGEDGGFFAGHVAATICWIAMAAALFAYAARRPKADRSLPIAGGMALVAAAMAKLFLFDLGTLDGIFRVVVFMVVGLVLLGMGAGYARFLDKQDEKQYQQQDEPV